MLYCYSSYVEQIGFTISYLLIFHSAAIWIFSTILLNEICFSPLVPIYSFGLKSNRQISVEYIL